MPCKVELESLLLRGPEYFQINQRLTYLPVGAKMIIKRWLVKILEARFILGGVSF